MNSLWRKEDAKSKLKANGYCKESFPSSFCTAFPWHPMGCVALLAPAQAGHISSSLPANSHLAPKVPSHPGNLQDPCCVVSCKYPLHHIHHELNYFRDHLKGVFVPTSTTVLAFFPLKHSLLLLIATQGPGCLGHVFPSSLFKLIWFVDLQRQHQRLILNWSSQPKVPSP